MQRKGGSHTKNRFFTAFLKKSRTGCVKMGLAHEKKNYLQEKANLFEIGSSINSAKIECSRTINDPPAAFLRI